MCRSVLPALLTTAALLGLAACSSSDPDPGRGSDTEARGRSSALRQEPARLVIGAPRVDAARGELLIRGGWGSAPGLFGKRDEASRPGPMSLAADTRGRLYLLDQVNRRICVHDRDGRLIRLIALDAETVEELALDPEGRRLWTLTYEPGPAPGYRVDALDLPGGTPGLRVPLHREIQLVTGLAVDGPPDRADVWVEVRHEWQVRVVRAGRALPPEEQLTRRRGRRAPGGRLLAAREGLAAVVSRVGPDGAERPLLRIEAPAPLLAIQALAADRRGRLHVALLLAAEAARPRRVLAVHDGRDGAAAAILELGGDSVTDAFRSIEVGPDGQVYRLRTTEAGVEVWRWRP